MSCSYSNCFFHFLETTERVAVKILNKSRLDTKTNAMLRREIKTMESLHHPNMIQIFETIETVSKHYIVMELAGGGELFNVITEQGRFPEKEAKFFFAQIVSAIEHMVSCLLCPTSSHSRFHTHSTRTI